MQPLFMLFSGVMRPARSGVMPPYPKLRCPPAGEKDFCSFRRQSYTSGNKPAFRRAGRSAR